MKNGEVRERFPQIRVCSNCNYTGHMVKRQGRWYGNIVNTIPCVHSDLMYFMIITLPFVCVLEARGQTQKTFGISSELRVRSKHAIFWAWELVLEQTQISDVLKTV